METPKQVIDTRANVFLWDTSAPSPTAFAVKPPIRLAKMVQPQQHPEIGADRLPLLSSPMVGLKPSADGIRNLPPFGLPKREGRHERTRQSTGGVASSQVDPPQGGTGARVQRHRRLRDRSSLREVLLNGFPGAFAEVFRHRVSGGGRRVPDAAPTGVSDATKVGEPAYPRYNRGAGEGRCPFDPRQTRAPVDGAGGGVAPLPPVAARLDG